MPATSKLASALAEVRKRIARARTKGPNEQNTKATLIEPVLRALGWDTEEDEQVDREFRIKRSDEPVDYGLLVLREPKLFVEAKALGDNLDDRRWTNQIMGYAGVAGVEWIVLTDGDEYRIFNTHASVPVDEKLFRTVRVTDDTSHVADTLALLARDQLDANRIEALWKAQFVDRRVKPAIEALFNGDSDLVLVNHVIGRTKSLSADDVRASLRRCKVTLNFPVNDDVFEMHVDTTSHKKTSNVGGTRKAPAVFDVSLKQLIDAGILRPPVALTAPYRHKTLTARIEKDGTVSCAGTTYKSLSLAGGAARAPIMGLRAGGKLPATGGWTFWKYRATDGTEQKIDHARQAFIRGKLGAAQSVTG